MGVSREELCQVPGEIEILGAVARRVDEDKLLMRVLFQGLGERTDRLDGLEAHAENGRVGAQLLAGGDAVAVVGNDVSGAPRGDAELHRELYQHGGLTGA